MSNEDTKIMNELIEEHKYGRDTVAELIEAKRKYIKSDNTLDIIIEKLSVLTEFYPKHKEKEDKIFFSQF